VRVNAPRSDAFSSPELAILNYPVFPRNMTIRDYTRELRTMDSRAERGYTGCGSEAD